MEALGKLLAESEVEQLSIIDGGGEEFSSTFFDEKKAQLELLVLRTSIY
jgi:hypothetical protein